MLFILRFFFDLIILYVDMCMCESLATYAPCFSRFGVDKYSQKTPVSISLWLQLHYNFYSKLVFINKMLCIIFSGVFTHSHVL